MSRRAILCVDDEAIILLSLVQELKTAFRDQFIYEKATNAKAAVEIIEDLVEEGMDLILVISDWLMPGVKGDEFLDCVCAKSPKIRAIMITGQADDEAISRVESKECVLSVIRKPWSPKALTNLIAEYYSLEYGGD